jgi:hypothetical protein
MPVFNPSENVLLALLVGVSILSGGVVFWGLWGDAIRGIGHGRRRCPRCWYDMRATDSLHCPECGHGARRERRLHKWRRRWWLVALAAVPLAPALALLIIHHGWQAEQHAIDELDWRNDVGAEPVAPAWVIDHLPASAKPWFERVAGINLDASGHNTEGLARFPWVYSANIWFWDPGKLPDLAVFDEARALEHLSLFSPYYGNSIPALTAADCAHLARLPRLKELYIDQLAIDDSGLRLWKNLPRIEYLSVLGTETLTGEGFEDWPANSPLRNLYLKSPGLSDRGLAATARLSNLSSLRLSGGFRARVTAAGIRELGRLKNLRDLELVDLPLDRQGFRAVGALGQLEWLSFFGRHCGVTAEALAELSNLHHMAWLDLGDAGDDSCVPALADLPALRRLDLRKGTRITRAALDRFLPDIQIEHPDGNRGPIAPRTRP